ncbi:MarR family transcriptional regulator [Streptomyces aureus]|uniref:MarR family transcriptional regulator n=1 Tax=Streptomyces aureus TaxID=193461 RepID=A0ABV4SE69_9ACTN
MSEAPGKAMRMNELAAACGISSGWMTRVVTRLDRRGWVERTKCAQDGFPPSVIRRISCGRADASATLRRPRPRQ